MKYQDVINRTEIITARCYGTSTLNVIEILRPALTLNKSEKKQCVHWEFTCTLETIQNDNMSKNMPL